jgi:hypothetical protein
MKLLSEKESVCVYIQMFCISVSKDAIKLLLYVIALTKWSSVNLLHRLQLQSDCVQKENRRELISNIPGSWTTKVLFKNVLNERKRDKATKQNVSYFQLRYSTNKPLSHFAVSLFLSFAYFPFSLSFLLPSCFGRWENRIRAVGRHLPPQNRPYFGAWMT